jgi:hypothetical protein
MAILSGNRDSLSKSVIPLGEIWIVGFRRQEQGVSWWGWHEDPQKKN